MKRRFLQVFPVLLLLGCATDWLPGNRDDAAPVERDPTPVGVTDQGENSTDLSITRRIRKAVMREDALSFSAKNTKIITREGRVTLQGSLKSRAERDVLVATARGVAGEGRVEDQLRIQN